MEVCLPICYQELLTSNARYKLFYGGRAGGKSFAFADALLIKATAKKTLIACVREVQNSIKDSVYKLIVDRITFYNLKQYKIYEDKIINTNNNSKFIFKGILEHNAQNIKSLEGVDICWIEEAQKISAKAWQILNPTIRKNNSQIWISMNREEENDPIFKVLNTNPDEQTIIRKVNFYDNPYCPKSMIQLANKMKVDDFEEYLHVWEGEPKLISNNHLISRKDVYKAIEQNVVIIPGTAPLIIGLDVARFGDDKTAFCFRQGRKVIEFKTFAKLDVVQVANLAANFIKEYNPIKMCIDIGGLGAGVYDVLLANGFGDIIVPINFGSKADNIERYVNKRAEMWARINDWLLSQLPVDLPKFDGLVEDLTTPLKMFDNLGRLQLEPKTDIKKRIGRSTDVADALALSFAILHEEALLKISSYNEFVDDNVYI